MKRLRLLTFDSSEIGWGWAALIQSDCESWKGSDGNGPTTKLDLDVSLPNVEQLAIFFDWTGMLQSKLPHESTGIKQGSKSLVGLDRFDCLTNSRLASSDSGGESFSHKKDFMDFVPFYEKEKKTKLLGINLIQNK